MGLLRPLRGLAMTRNKHEKKFMNAQVAPFPKLALVRAAMLKAGDMQEIDIQLHGQNTAV
jgi:hypothetical protein